MITMHKKYKNLTHPIGKEWIMNWIKLYTKTAVFFGAILLMGAHSRIRIFNYSLFSHQRTLPLHT